MIIIAVKFIDWNNNERTIDVTSDMCEALVFAPSQEDKMVLAIKYIKRRYLECMSILSVEFIAD